MLWGGLLRLPPPPPAPTLPASACPPLPSPPPPAGDGPGHLRPHPARGRAPPLPPPLQVMGPGTCVPTLPEDVRTPYLKVVSTIAGLCSLGSSVARNATQMLQMISTGECGTLQGFKVYIWVSTSSQPHPQSHFLPISTRLPPPLPLCQVQPAHPPSLAQAPLTPPSPTPPVPPSFAQVPLQCSPRWASCSASSCNRRQRPTHGP